MWSPQGWYSFCFLSHSAWSDRFSGSILFRLVLQLPLCTIDSWGRLLDSFYCILFWKTPHYPYNFTILRRKCNLQLLLTEKKKKKEKFYNNTWHAFFRLDYFFEFIQSDFGTSKEYFKKISNKIVDTLSIKWYLKLPGKDLCVCRMRSLWTWSFFKLLLTP